MQLQRLLTTLLNDMKTRLISFQRSGDELAKRRDHLNTNSNVLYPISIVTGPDFNNKEIAGRCWMKIVSVLILIINCLVKVW